MNPSYIPIIVMLIIVFILWAEHMRSLYAGKKAIKRNKEGESREMKELAERFIDKECIVYTFNSQQIEGVIKEVTDGAVLLERKDSTEAINLDFIVRIRDYPRRKDGKKKSVYI